MEIVNINPEDLVFYENNPRDNDEAVPIIANSIERFGFKVPVMIDSNKVIICGHTRVKAALNLGLETVPCIIEDEMSEEDIRAFRIVENKTHELSFWDSSLLRLEMDALDEIEWEDFGFDEVREFSDSDVDALFDEQKVPKQKTTLDNWDSKEDSDSDSQSPKGFICPFCGKEIVI